jgi:hypothetical protein
MKNQAMEEELLFQDKTFPEKEWKKNTLTQL